MSIDYNTIALFPIAFIEFYVRYAPLMDQQISTWTVEGVNLYRENPYSCNKQTCSVGLDNLSTKSSGV